MHLDASFLRRPRHRSVALRSLGYVVVVAAKGGPTFMLAGRGLASGSHTISARAYDNAGPELVRQTTGTVWGRMNWARSVQTVT